MQEKYCALITVLIVEWLLCDEILRKRVNEVSPGCGWVCLGKQNCDGKEKRTLQAGKSEMSVARPKDPLWGGKRTNPFCLVKTKFRSVVR